MTLYRLQHTIGSNDWVGIAATGKIPGKSLQSITFQWHNANRYKNYNSLEKAFKDARAKVAKQTETGKLEGTVIDYEMNSETRVGTWTIEWGNGPKERMEKDCLLSLHWSFSMEKCHQKNVHIHWSGATTWSDSKRMTLYRLRQVKGNDWVGIAATGKIPGKSLQSI